MMQGSPFLGDAGFRVVFLSSVLESSSGSRTRLFLPYSKPTYECIRVLAQPGARGQFSELLGVSTTEHDFFRLHGVTKLLHNFPHVLLPFLSP
jgi:hypothetical protein